MGSSNCDKMVFNLCTSSFRCWLSVLEASQFVKLLAMQQTIQLETLLVADASIDSWTFCMPCWTSCTPNWTSYTFPWISWALDRISCVASLKFSSTVSRHQSFRGTATEMEEHTFRIYDPCTSINISLLIQDLANIHLYTWICRLNGTQYHTFYTLRLAENKETEYI